MQEATASSLLSKNCCHNHKIPTYVPLYINQVSSVLFFFYITCTERLKIQYVATLSQYNLQVTQNPFPFHALQMWLSSHPYLKSFLTPALSVHADLKSALASVNKNLYSLPFQPMSSCICCHWFQIQPNDSVSGQVVHYC